LAARTSWAKQIQIQVVLDKLFAHKTNHVEEFLLDYPACAVSPYVDLLVAG